MRKLKTRAREKYSRLIITTVNAHGKSPLLPGDRFPNLIFILLKGGAKYAHALQRILQLSWKGCSNRF